MEDEPSRDMSQKREPDLQQRALEPRIRPLTEAERRLLRCKIRQYRRSPGALDRSIAITGAGIVGVLWLATLLASDVSWPVVTGIWVVLGSLIYLWVRRDLRRELGPLSEMVSSLESALERNEAESFDIAAQAYAEFQEVEDEGACYAFDLGEGRIVFLVGQPFYPSARFPSLDFSVVHPLDGDGRAADLWIEKRGDAVPPQRVIPADIKWELAERIPDSLDVVRGGLDTLEESLRGSRA